MSFSRRKSLVFQSAGPMRRPMVVLVGCFVGLLSAFVAGAEKKPATLTLEQQFGESAGDVLRQLIEKKVTKVGVLKFAIEEAGRGPLKSPCSFSLRLAEHLESALLVAMSSPKSSRVELAHDASSVASGLRDANHHTPEGRKILFDAQYPLAWGGKKATLDGLLTGVAEVTPNRKTIRVSILLIQSNQSEDQTASQLLHSFLIPTTVPILAELGESFHLRSPGQVSTDLAMLSRANPAQSFPLADRPGVKLTILYDNHPVTMEFRDQGAWIPEPQAGQAVSLMLQRSDNQRGNLGAVLKINGENTLFRERFPDAECHRWVLPPGGRPLLLKGFQMSASKDQAEQFKVVTRARSAELLPDYGADLGTISLTVFREADAAAAERVAHERPETADLRVIAKGFFPSQPARNLDHLLTQLRIDAEQPQTRGAILAGDTVRQKIELNKYVWEKSPHFSVTIRYYSP